MSYNDKRFAVLIENKDLPLPDDDAELIAKIEAAIRIVVPARSRVAVQLLRVVSPGDVLLIDRGAPSDPGAV